jgi:alkanesulfonate monooxygenase SsuD/methylene tetrahydromethanopterin reductase-like flavin-dependent oxidoreductase (luciferase family)
MNSSTQKERAAKLRALFAERIVVIDGAMGTMIQKRSLGEADYRGQRFADWKQDLKGCNDLLVITRPDVIADIHGQFVDAVDMTVQPMPLQKPHPPIWLGGDSDGQFKRIVRVADGWHGLFGGTPGGRSEEPTIEQVVLAANAPHTVVGIAIALLVLLPETWAALRAARANRLQTSFNLALGSALASIGLTIPAWVGVSIALGLPLVLGLSSKEMVLLALTFIVGILTLSTGRTNVLQGTVHLMIFAAFLFLSLFP